VGQPENPPPMPDWNRLDGEEDGDTLAEKKKEKAVQEGLAYLAGLAKYGEVLTLDRIAYMMEALGHPQLTYPVIHVAGTMGKGSTCRMLAEILQEAGLKTGLFSKPHLERYNERIMVQGREIADTDLLALIEQMKILARETAEHVGHPTEFEMSTAMAFTHFAQVKVDVAVIETGLGGLWDSTNVVQPEVSVITPIGFDHMDRLGWTLPEIAEQKAGIIKPGRPVVLAPQKEEVWPVLLQEAARKGAHVIRLQDGNEGGNGGETGGETGRETGSGDGGGICGNSHGSSDSAATPAEEVRFWAKRWDLSGGCFDLAGADWCWSDLTVGLLGRHQIVNAAVAAATCHLLQRSGRPVSVNHVRDGLAKVRWPGRLEILAEKPQVIIDGAHSIDRFYALREAIDDLLPGRRIILVMGALAEKPVQEELALLLPKVAGIVCTQPASGRTAPLPAARLAEMVVAEMQKGSAGSRPDLPVWVCEKAWEAVELARKIAAADQVVLVTGSIYLIGEVRRAWFDNERNKPSPCRN